MENERRDRVFVDIQDAREFVHHFFKNLSRRLLTDELISKQSLVLAATVCDDF